MHLKRWITSIVALPVLILLILKGGAFLFFTLICIVSLIALNEYLSIVYSNRELGAFNKFSIVAFISTFIIMVGAYNGSANIIMAAVTFNILLLGCTCVFTYKVDPMVLDDAFKQALGIIYIPLLSSYLIMIRDHESSDGVTWIFFLLLLVAAGDTGAFYSGTFFGKNKLCPSVSPGKTVEGFIGGIIATIIMGTIFKIYFLEDISFILSILFFIFIGITGPVGDLFESVLKRVSKVKDSGKILPGHGGILDRIDALLFAAPVAYLFKVYIF